MNGFMDEHDQTVQGKTPFYLTTTVKTSLQIVDLPNLNYWHYSCASERLECK